MSYDYPNSISHDAYITLLNNGLPTTSGNIAFNEATYQDYSYASLYGLNSLVAPIANLVDCDHDQILFYFTKTIEGYTNRNLGDITLDIKGVGIHFIQGEGAYICPVDANGNLLTNNYSLGHLDVATVADTLDIVNAKLALVMTYIEAYGGYHPTIAVVSKVDETAYPLIYLDWKLCASLTQFSANVGNDIFEYALFGKYWNEEETAPDNGTDGGGGTPPTDEQLEMPDLPTTGALSTHLISAYNVTLSELQSLGQYLWSNSFVDNILKNYQDPFQNIVSCHILPFNPSLIPSHASNIFIGNMDSNINSHRVNDTSEFIELNFGKIYLKSMYNTFGDFDTRVTLFLPYSGYIELDVSDLMGNGSGGGYISVKYRVDILTGDFIATVEASTPFSEHYGVETHIIEQKTGNMASQIPLSGSNYLSVYNTLFASIGQFASSNILGGVGTLMQTKPQYSKTGNVGGNTGRLGYNRPYLLVHYPNYREPKLWRGRNGVISNIAFTLSSLSGFIQVKKDTFKGDSIPCTQTELEMITDLLESGVVTNED